MRRMYDSINPAAIPVDAQMVAGYVDGIYGPNHAAYHQPGWDDSAWARFPNSVKVRIAISPATDDGHVLDVETGDASPAQAPGWVAMRRGSGLATPAVYVNESNWPATRNAFVAQGIPEPLWWLALYDNSAVLPAGCVAKQYIDPPQSGGDYDLSVVADDWPGVDTTPQEDDEVKPQFVQVQQDDGQQAIWCIFEGRYWHVASGADWSPWQAAGYTAIGPFSQAQHDAWVAAYAPGSSGGGGGTAAAHTHTFSTSGTTGSAS